MTEYADPDLEAIADLPPLPPEPESETPASRPGRSRSNLVAVGAALVVVSLVVGFAVATVVVNARDSEPTAVAIAPTPTFPNFPSFPAFPTIPGFGSGSTAAPTTPTVPSQVPIDPHANVLGGLILRQSDVGAGNTVQLLKDGTSLSVATLDLCNGTFPSEQLRTARRQVALTHDTQLSPTLQMSTEAVLYGAPAGGAQAFRELQSVAENCPSTPVKSPVGEGTATTNFRKAPDANWPHTPTVERLAYDFDTVDAATGQSTHSMAVYLRRGRALVGVYFSRPDEPQVAVDGRTSIAGIVALFEARLAKVPASVTGP